MSEQSKLLETLATLVDEKGVLSSAEVAERGIGIWRQGNVAAKALVRPSTTSQLSAVMKTCHDANQSVVVHGGLTGLVEGADATLEDIVISLERMNQIEEIDPAGRTMTVQAGTPLQIIQEAAEAQGMSFMLDLGARGSCQIGGNVSTNAGGTRVLRYGMTRENILGLEAVLADGTVMSSLNSVIKNNAGYDLKQLFIGTEGTIGIVTRLVLRLRETPRSQDTAFAGFDSFTQVIQFLKFVDAELGGSLSAFEVMWNGYYQAVTAPMTAATPPVSREHRCYVLVEALGGAPEDDTRKFENALMRAHEAGHVAEIVVAQSGKERDQMWEIRHSVDVLFNYGDVILFDVSLPIKHMESYVDEVHEAIENRVATARNYTLGHIADGNIHFNVGVEQDTPDVRSQIEDCVYQGLDGLSGSVSAEHGIGVQKKDYLPLSKSATEIEMMRRLKHAFDPKGLLNRNKIFDFV